MAVVDENLRDQKISVINVQNAVGQASAPTLQGSLAPKTPSPSVPETQATTILETPETSPSSPPKVEEKKKTGRVRPPKKYVQYEVIGRNNVAVPTHLFKVGS